MQTVPKKMDIINYGGKKAPFVFVLKAFKQTFFCFILTQ